MPKLYTLRSRIVSIISMVLGTAMVLALLIAMNEYMDNPDFEKGKTVAAFSVQKKTPPKKKKRPKKVIKKRRARQKKANVAPRPSVNSSLAGLDLGLPSFDASQIGDLSDSILGDMKNVVMSENSVDTPPRPARRTAVSYPAQARKKGITGFVTLNLLIDQTGKVQSVKVLEAEPQGEFEQAAMDTVREWNFEPAMYEGNPVKVWAKQTIRFQLT